MSIGFKEMMAMQQELAALHKGQWWPQTPENAHKFMLCMMEEVGESIAVWKKKGDAAIMADPAVRGAFLEEMVDTLMFFNDCLLCYGVSPEEISAMYRNKHGRNMGRDYAAEYKEKYHG